MPGLLQPIFLGEGRGEQSTESAKSPRIPATLIARSMSNPDILLLPIFCFYFVHLYYFFLFVFLLHITNQVYFQLGFSEGGGAPVYRISSNNPKV